MPLQAVVGQVGIAADARIHFVFKQIPTQRIQKLANSLCQSDESSSLGGETSVGKELQCKCCAA